MPELRQRIPTLLLWAEPVSRPPIDVMVRVAVALRGSSAVPDSIAIMLIRHWVHEIGRTPSLKRAAGSWR